MNRRTKLLVVFLVLSFLLMSVSVASAATLTKTVKYTKSYKNLLGITVASHTATTWWTYDGISLYSYPKGVSTDWYCAPLFYCVSYRHGWDWYNVGALGSGRSYSQAVFYAGLAIKDLVNIGQNFTSTIRTNVYYNGFSYYF